ncbi:MAG: glycerol-3-phosphate 1-O-acyltransferase PlsY [Gemmatimonadota bacterium]|nr:glycerol-3-phosphate 1-O-acyltransferase PlsY [Gemmatimonadota bacterium]
MSPFDAALCIVASYFLGAIPTSYLVARGIAGIDLREHGSRNLGATNLYRCLGWRYALPVGLFDIAKGAVPVVLIAPFASRTTAFAVACGITAVIGHVFSVFVKFKGGKGVATAAGVVLGLTPVALGIAFVVWAGLVWLTGYVSVGSIAGALVLPVAVFILRPADRALAWVYLGIALFVVWAHRANIRRLLAGTENRFGRGAAARPAS